MKCRIFLILSMALLVLTTGTDGYAKKIKNTLRIDKEKSGVKDKRLKLKGKCVNFSDSSTLLLSSDSLLFKELNLVGFSGYDKEPNSNKESFILVNPSRNCITGFSVRIDYLDMKGRMLHSRELTEQCLVPPGETRRLDTKSWDIQHTYYYYLGNEPKRVATPFQVVFTPLSFWISQQ